MWGKDGKLSNEGGFMGIAIVGLSWENVEYAGLK